MKEAILGLDIGTSSIKSGLFDLNGRELINASSDYKIIQKTPEIIEIDTDELWKSVIKSIRQIADLSSGKYSIASIGICAMMIMPVLIDSDKKVIRPVIHWFDSRLKDQYYLLKQKGFDKLIVNYSGSALTGESTVNALSWVKRHEPQNYKKISRFFMLKDFIRFRLTGEVLSDFGDASGSQMLDTKKWRWSDELIQELGFSRNIFPDLLKPFEIGGYITGQASNLTGLKRGTPVAIGSGDGITTIFGLGICQEGQVGITVGSAGVIAAPVKTYPKDSKLRTYIFCHPMCDRWFSLMATASSGEIFKWYHDNVIKDKEISYSDLDGEAADSSPGSDGLLFLPYLLGSRSPHSNPGAWGALLGLRYRHKRRDITRAILEGVSYELKEIFEVEKEILSVRNININEIRISGGITKSLFWQQLLADILTRDLLTTKVKELGTSGSSVIASVAAGFYKDLDKAVKEMVDNDGIIKHDRSLEELYMKKFENFLKTYKTLEPAFGLLSK